jgi:hypothetical protein
MAANPTSVIPVDVHGGDDLECTDGGVYLTDFAVTSYPSASVDRYKMAGNKIPQGGGSWTSSVNTRKAMSAIVSVSFDNVQVSGNTYTGNIKVKFNTPPTAGVPLKINVLALEDSIAAVGSLEQTNADSSTYQPGNNPLVNYYHNKVFRDAVNGAWGSNGNLPAVPAVGTEYSEPFIFIKSTSWKQKNMSLVAYVAYDGAAASNQKEVLNAEKFSMQYLGPLAVNDVNKNSLKANVYPNPATLQSNITTSFTLKNDATVTMEILNTMGQVISVPYSSFEIAGAHSITWKPAYQLSQVQPGVYFVRLKTNKGEMQMNKLILE